MITDTLEAGMMAFLMFVEMHGSVGKAVKTLMQDEVFSSGGVFRPYRVRRN